MFIIKVLYFPTVYLNDLKFFGNQILLDSYTFYFPFQTSDTEKALEECLTRQAIICQNLVPSALHFNYQTLFTFLNVVVLVIY